MLDLTLSNVSLMLLASAGAGLVDAIVGGGGLIIVPSLFGLFPQAVPATLLGTNKAASIWGTGWAALQYARRVKLPSARLMGAIVAAMLGGLLGAWLATLIPAVRFRVALPFVLAAVWAYTLWRKDLGHHHAPHWSARGEVLIATGIGGLIGFYDGVFGPGTGSFLMLGFIALAGYGILKATAHTKFLNFGSNLGAFAVFLAFGAILWKVGLIMGAAQFLGAQLGSRYAMRQGARIIKPLLVTMSVALALRLLADPAHPLRVWLGM